MIKGCIHPGNKFDSLKRTAGDDLRPEALLNSQGLTLAFGPGMKFRYFHIPPLHLPHPAGYVKLSPEPV